MHNFRIILYLLYKFVQQSKAKFFSLDTYGPIVWKQKERINEYMEPIL